MSFRGEFVDSAHSKLQKITMFSGNSLPTCLGIGILETVGLFSGTYPQYIERLVYEVDSIIKEAKSYYPDYEDSIEFYNSIFKYIKDLKDAKQSLCYLYGLTIDRATTEYITKMDLASRIIIACMMLKKFEESGELDLLNLLFQETDISVISCRVLEKFTIKFFINIKVFEETSKEGIHINPKHGIFPIIHLYKDKKAYGLGYPACYFNIFLGNFEAEEIDSALFLHGKAVKKTPVQIEPLDDISVLKYIITEMNREIQNKGGYSEELKDIITKCQSRNLTFKNLSLGFVATQCIRCGRSDEITFNSSHKTCKVCDECVIQNNYTCVNCNNQLTKEDLKVLKLEYE